MKFWITIGILVTGFIGLVVFNRVVAPDTSQSAPKNAYAQLIGKPAPDFNLLSYSGQQTSLSSFRGKKVVLFFSEGIVCYPACWNQIASLGEDKDLNNSQIATVSIVPDQRQDWDTAIKRQPNLGTEPILFDDSIDVSKNYGVLSLDSSMHKGVKPGHTYVVIDQSGIVRYTYDDPTMGIQNNKLKQELGKI